ncbi:MAG TPA: hypothetical protein VGI71_24010 [Scandinavium sp.]|jgi:hypothetical protein
MSAPAYMEGIGTEYFEWLHAQVFPNAQKGSPDSYTYVMEKMHQLIFKVLVPHDENRIADGDELRKSFQISRGGLEPLETSALLYPDISVLEVLIALADRGGFMIDRPMQEMFGLFLQNLRLSIWTDGACVFNIKRSGKVIKILNRFNDRAYTAHGTGGLFPLRDPSKDQRQVELWYQMGEWMTENAMY